jgi:hypothetical protein
VINGDDPYNQKLFDSPVHPCTAVQLECQMLDSIIIWEKSVIHNCPYEFIGEDTFKSRNNSIFLWSENLLVESTVRSFDCDMSLIETTEGFYLTTSPKAKNLPRSKESPQVASSYMLDLMNLISYMFL